MEDDDDMNHDDNDDNDDDDDDDDDGANLPLDECLSRIQSKDNHHLPVK